MKIGTTLTHHKEYVREYNTPELISLLEKVPYRKAPDFLGDFQFRMVRRNVPDALNACKRSFHQAIQFQIGKLASLIPEQQFNTVFIQRYERGQGVRPHRDPKNNTGFTVIGLYGDEWQTQFSVEASPTHWNHFDQFPGDVMIVPCTIDGVQGPRHEMRWTGTGYGPRYAIILNTIENK